MSMSLSAGFSGFCFVFEMGTEKGEPHLHYWVKSGKSRNTIVTSMRKHFKLPTDRANRYSMKACVESKKTQYFLYLAKGVFGKKEDEVLCVSESDVRMWTELHAQFHANAEAFRARAVPVREDWYESLAAPLRASGRTSKEDVLQAVTRFYVYESKKGFDRFLVMRTFWRVFALANAADAHSLVLEQCMASLSI